MKERRSLGDFPGLKLCLGAFAILLSYTTVFGHVNHCRTTDCRFLFSVDSTTDSISCAYLSDDSLTNFVRFDHSDNEYDYYYLRLSMFSDRSERLFFYEEARGIEFYMTDKREIFNDSALFSTSMSDRVQFLSTIADFYHSAKDQKQAAKSQEETPKEGNSGLYKPAEPIDNGHDSPMDVSLVCDGAQVACSENVYSYPAGTSGQAPPPVNGYPNYGCLGSEPCPAWFYMQVGVAGDIIIFISQSGNHDVDFICWGPFSSLTDGCATGLTGTCTHNGYPPPLCCSNPYPACNNFYPRGNMVDCSYSPNATETCHILNAQECSNAFLLNNF